MVTCFDSNNFNSGMYRHHQQVAGPGMHQFHNPSMPWYPTGYHHQGPQLTTPSAFCVQDDQQMWHHHTHPVFQNDFQDNFIEHGVVPHQHQIIQQQMQLGHEAENQIPSPPMTLSGSELSASPGIPGDNCSSQTNLTRPPPARSPYEWIKKTSYQTQPNPDDVPFGVSDYKCTGKTRTRDKYRVVYTDHQRLELEKEFTFNNRYITIRRKSELAAALGLSERQIKIWFQNRRAKERKLNKKRTEEVKNPSSALIESNNTSIDHPQLIAAAAAAAAAAVNIAHHHHHLQQQQQQQQSVISIPNPNMCAASVPSPACIATAASDIPASVSPTFTTANTDFNQLMASTNQNYQVKSEQSF